MIIRRAVAVLAAAAVAVSTAVSASPSYAAEAPRLLGASSIVDTGLVPVSVDATFRFAGDVVTLEATWSTGTGANLQTISSGGYQINPGLSVFHLVFPQRDWMQQGTWTLTKVRLRGHDGFPSVTYGPGALALPGPPATFTLTTGPTSLAAMGDLVGTLTDATVTSPAGSPKTIAVSGDLKATLTYAGATPGTTSYTPVYTAPGGLARGLVGAGVGATAGTVVIGGTASSSNYTNGTWSLSRVVGRAGSAVRVFDKDGYTTYIQSSTDLTGNGPDCSGYLGDYTGVALDPGCRVVSTSTTSVGGLGDTTNDVAMSGMADPALTAPVLTAATWSHPTVAVGGTTTLTVHYADAALAPSPGSELSAQLRLGSSTLQVQTSPTTTCAASPPAPVSCTVWASVQVPSDALSGVYTLDWIYSVNSSGNGTYYEPGSYVTHIAGRDTTVTPVPAASRAMFNATVTVTGGIAVDTAPPVLTSIVRTSAAQVDTTDSVATPAAAIFHWTGTDVGTGIARVEAALYSPSTQGFTTGAWVPTSPAVNGTSGDLQVSSYYAGVGDWVVRTVTVIDRRGNVRHYDADGAVFPGTTHTMDFASLAFTVLNGPTAAVPSAPRSLRVSGRDATIVATWAAPASAGGSAVTSYDVSLDAGATKVGPQTVTGTSATFTGLVNDTGYTVTVKAHNAQGFSPPAWAPGTWVHPVAPVVGPTIVNVFPDVSRKTGVPVEAVPPAAQAGAPVTGYVTQLRVAPPGAPLPATWSNSGVIRTTPKTVVNVAPGGRVCVRVAAVNSVGIGAVSNVRCTTVLGDERSLALSSGWKKATVASAYRRTLSTSTRVGASMVLAKAYGTRLTIAGRAVPRGGSIAVYVGASRVATLTFAQAKAGYVVRSVKVALRGQRVILVVTKQGAGVSLDGIAVSP